MVQTNAIPGEQCSPLYYWRYVERLTNVIGISLRIAFQFAIVLRDVLGPLFLLIFVFGYFRGLGIGVGRWWGDDRCLYFERGSIFYYATRSPWKDSNPIHWTFIANKSMPLWSSINTHGSPDFSWKWPYFGDNACVEYARGNAFDPIFRNPSPVRYVAFRTALHPIAVIFFLLWCIARWRRWKKRVAIRPGFPVLQRPPPEITPGNSKGTGVINSDVK